MKNKKIYILTLLIIISFFRFNMIAKAADTKDTNNCYFNLVPKNNYTTVLINWKCGYLSHVEEIVVYNDEKNMDIHHRVRLRDGCPNACLIDGKNGKDKYGKRIMACCPLIENAWNGTITIEDLDIDNTYVLYFKTASVVDYVPAAGLLTPLLPAYQIVGKTKGENVYNFEPKNLNLQLLKADSYQESLVEDVVDKFKGVIKDPNNGIHTPSDSAASSPVDVKDLQRQIVTAKRTIQTESYCDKKLKALIHKYWNYIMFLTPILLITLLTIDGVKCVMAGNAEKIKKFSNDAVKRVLIALILLALPNLISIIMIWFGLGDKICF